MFEIVNFELCIKFSLCLVKKMYLKKKEIAQARCRTDLTSYGILCRVF